MRETLATTGKVALATVVLHTRQHLALIRPLDEALVMITLRWPDEVRGLDTLELDTTVTKAKVDKRELDMAKRLVQDMAGTWSPDEYHDAFRDTIMELVAEKASKGKIETVEKGEDSSGEKSADIIDLTELLKRSLGGKSTAPPKKKPAAAAKKPAKRTRKAS